MANDKKKGRKLPVVAGKLFGLTKDPVLKFNYQCYHLVTATVDEDGEIIDVEKSDQSWFLWEALHKMERAQEEEVVNLQRAVREVRP